MRNMSSQPAEAVSGPQPFTPLKSRRIAGHPPASSAGVGSQTPGQRTPTSVTRVTHGVRRTAPRRRAGRIVAVSFVLVMLLGIIIAFRITSSGAPSSAGLPPASGGQESEQATVPAEGIDPELMARFEQAAADAATEGIELTLTSGWRSAQDQQMLVEQALERYGTAEEAHRWVLPPEASAHVAGLAIDVGPTEGALWLGQHNADYDLCRTYQNEVWHFELNPDPGRECAPMLPDSSSGWS
jgi:zinc D-Ala-D-Ala carboxypeptidase